MLPISLFDSSRGKQVLRANFTYIFMNNKLKKIVNLLIFFWVQRVRGYPAQGPPHFDQESEAMFKRYLLNAKLYVEYGCGGSTLVADEMNVETLSIESDPYYAKTVRKGLKLISQVRIIDVSIGLTGQWGCPVFKKSTSKRIEKWNKYPVAPYEHLENDRVPDLILVDGRFRRACALESARRARLSGKSTVIMFDDYYVEGREQHYKSVEPFLGHPVRVGRTAFFIITPDDMTETIDQNLVMDASSDYR